MRNKKKPMNCLASIQCWHS